MTELTKSKVRQLYQFLKQANQLRYTPIRNLESQEKFIRFAEMPSHPTLQIQRPIRVDEETQETPEFLVRVRRPLQTLCPTPPQPLQKWLLSGGDDPTKSVLNRPGSTRHFRAVGIDVFRTLPEKRHQTCCGGAWGCRTSQCN